MSSTASAFSGRHRMTPWWLVLLEGIALIIIGIWLFQQPVGAVTTIVFILGIYWIISGIFNFVRLIWDRRVWGWKIFTGIIGILAGYFVIQYPLGSTAVVGLTLIYFLAFIGIFVGIGNLIQAFTGAGWGTGILGVVSIVLGVLLLMNSGIATLSLPWTLGLLAIFGGILAIINAFRYRGVQHDLEDAAEAARAQGASAAAAIDRAGTRTGTAVAGAGAGLAAAATAASQSVDDAASDAADSVQDTADAVVAGAKSVAGDAADAVDDAQDAVVDTAGDVADAVDDTVDSAVAGTSDAVAGLKTRLFGVDEEITPEEIAAMGDTYASLPEGTRRQISGLVNTLAYITPEQAAQLNAQGVTDLKSLLEAGATPQGRADLAKTLGVDTKDVLTWVNFADLQRIKGVGVKYSYLLEMAGVDTVVELANRNPDNLYEKLLAVDLGESYVISPPSADDVLDWVSQAKDLPRAVHY